MSGARLVFTHKRPGRSVTAARIAASRPNPPTGRPCPDCDGPGTRDLFTGCDTCNGLGILPEVEVELVCDGCGFVGAVAIDQYGPAVLAYPKLGASLCDACATAEPPFRADVDKRAAPALKSVFGRVGTPEWDRVSAGWAYDALTCRLRRLFTVIGLEAYARRYNMGSAAGVVRWIGADLLLARERRTEAEGLVDIGIGRPLGG